MAAGTQSVPRSGRRWLRGATMLLVLAGLAGCQAGQPDQPIVYTAPPDIMNRTYPPVPSPSASPGPSDSAAPSGVLSSDTPVLGATAGASIDPARVGRPPKGGVIFGTAAGPVSCSVLNPSDVLSSSDPFFFVAYLTDQMDGTKPVTLHVVKDGATLADDVQPATGSSFDCFGNQKPITALPPGAYEFQILLARTVEADGSVTIR